MENKEKIISILSDYLDMLESKKHQIENLVGSIDECRQLEIYNEIQLRIMDVQDLLDELVQNN